MFHGRRDDFGTCALCEAPLIDTFGPWHRPYRAPSGCMVLAGTEHQKSTPMAPNDFESLAAKAGAGTFWTVPSSGWYTATWRVGLNPHVSLTATTQLRLRFTLPTDNDLADDYRSFFSGNATSIKRPVLQIYYLP